MLLALAALIACNVTTPLAAFNASLTAYRDMGFNLTITVDPLEPAPPPRLGWAPMPPADLHCSCSAEWSSSCSLTVPEKANTTCVLQGRVPADAELGFHVLDVRCSCRYTCWGLFPECVERNETTGECTRWEWRLHVRHCRLGLEGNCGIEVIPRLVDTAFLALEAVMQAVNATNGSARVSIALRLYNLAVGPPGAEPVETMLLLHNLTVLVDGDVAASIPGYSCPAQPIPPSSSCLELGVQAIVEAPRRTLNVTLCFTVDLPEPSTQCWSASLELPLTWSLSRVVRDDCTVLEETWVLGTPVVTVVDSVKPAIAVESGCAVAYAGACEEVRLRALSDGTVVGEAEGVGRAIWCPQRPGRYVVVAEDEFGNTVTAELAIEEAGPDRALQRALLGLAAALVALVLVLRALRV